MKLFSLMIAWVMIIAPLSGIAQTPTKFQTDILQFGRGATLITKDLIFDSGDGVSNKKLSLDPNDNEFDLTSTLNIAGGLTATSAISTTSGNISTAAGAISASGNISSSAGNLSGGNVTGTGNLDITGTSKHRSGITLGLGTDANKQITMDRAAADTYIKWDETLDKWVFSNDGSLEKPLGSGSGNGSGGINILVNSSFEDGLGSWTNFGGTFTQQTYATSMEGETKFSRFVASGAGQYVETVLTAVPTFLGAGCQAQFQKYATISDGAWKISVLDSGSNVLTTQNFNQSGGASTFIASPLISFPCPAAGATFKVRLESLAAATIDFDLAYGGGNKNTADIAQARIAGASYILGTASCTWSRTNGAIGPFATVAACPGPTIENSSIGEWQTTDSDLPRQSINNLPKGKYKATFFAPLQTSVASEGAIAISDGTTTCTGVKVTQLTGSAIAHVISCEFEYSTSGNRFFEIYVGQGSGSLSMANTNGINAVKFQLEYYPSDSQTAITSEQSGWQIDANIGGGNPSMSSSSVATYTSINSTTLDIVTNTGSSPVKIPCLNAVSQGSTCNTGPIAEEVGVVFTPPFAGFFDVCGNFSHYANPINGFNNTVFQWVETTSNSSTTILQEGKERSNSNHASSTTLNTIIPHRNCGTFYFSSVTEKTIRLMYEQTTSNVSASPFLAADRDATLGQRDIHITVRPSTMNTSRLVLTGDQVTTPNAVKSVLVSAFVADGSGVTTVSEEDGDWIQGNCANVANAGSSDCTFVASYWAVKPKCWISSTSLRVNRVLVTGTTSVNISLTTDAGATTDADYNIFCKGERN